MKDTIKGDYRVKKHYYILIFIIITVVAIFSSSLGTRVESLPPIIQGLIILAFILPTCLLLYFISKDRKIKNSVRNVAKFGIFFLLFCFIAGLLAEFG